MDVELETTSTPTTSHSQRKERRKQRQPDNNLKRGLQKIQGLSVQLLLQPQPGWLQLTFCPPSSLESAQAHTWECLAASPWWPRLTHTDPTPAPALWDLSQVFWRKSKLSECDGLFCSGFAHLQKLLFCWSFFLAFPACIPSSALPSDSCIHSKNPPNYTRSRAAPLPHHPLQREAGSRPNQASG